MENNRVVILNSSYKVISSENFPSAEAAYNGYTEAARAMSERLPTGEKAYVIRYRWGKPMTIETVVGNHE